jgi:NDP-sugar pyrophosphorylase family protein
MKQAVILAGGAGTRLRGRLGDVPKPMVPVGGRPLLEHQVELAKRYGITDLVLFVCHRADLIENYFGDGAKWGVRIRYVTEQEPLGTAGAVVAGFDRLADRFLVLYGDTMVNVDLQRMWNAHEQAHADATLLLHANDHPADSDLVETDVSGRIQAFHNRPHPAGHSFQNLANAALYVVDKRALAPFRGAAGFLDFCADLFPAMLARGAVLFGYSSPEYIRDIGTPERYDRVCAEHASGIATRSSPEVRDR